jgi:hypothetical protein
MQLQVIEPVAPRWSIMRERFSSAVADWKSGTRYLPVRNARILTPPSGNTKLSKSEVPTWGLTLAPAGASGYQLCPWRSPECEAACLGITSGRSRFSNVQQARITKTRQLMESPYAFMRQLLDELQRLYSFSGRRDWALRLNVLSDIPWENLCPDLLTFTDNNYDYTKSFDRAMKSLRWDHKYRLVLSHSGHNWDQCACYMDHGGTVAAVFGPMRGRFYDPKNYDLPETYKGYEVIDGDHSDARWLDPKGVIVGLRAKGSIDTNSPFVFNV